MGLVRVLLSIRACEYQFLALVISLMQDQVHFMKNLGIPAVYLSPARVKSGDILTRMHECRIAYITPELCMNRGQEFIQGIHSASETPFC